MKINKILFALSFITMLSSCTLVDLEDPLKGKTTLVTDWSKRTSGVDQPANYTVAINNQTLNYTQASNLLPELEAGTYPIRIYNTPEKISISGTTATVARSNNQVDPLPGWLFTASTQAVYADFKGETITAVMQQQVRQLTITLNTEGGTVNRIVSITTALSGVAGAWDFATNQPVGSAMNVPLTFAKRTDGTWQAIVRLLGVTGAGQKLTGTIAFDGGTPDNILLESNLSTDLSAFNADKKTPLTLSGEIIETTTEFGLTATISSWLSTDGTSGSAE